MNNSNDTLKVIGALVVGAVAGAALGILFAPDKGSNTRGKIVGGAKDMADDLKQKIKDEVKALKNKADDLGETASNKMGEMRNGFKQEVDALK